MRTDVVYQPGQEAQPSVVREDTIQYTVNAILQEISTPDGATMNLSLSKSCPGNRPARQLLCVMKIRIVSSHHDTYAAADNNAPHFAFRDPALAA